MNTTTLSSLPTMRPHQHGFVLIMSLLFLLLLTIIGITSLSTTSLEEKMAHNVKDKNLAGQSAESALALAESWLESSNTVSRTEINRRISGAPSTTDGFTATVNDPDPPIWRTMDWKATSAGDYLEYPTVPFGATTSTLLSRNLFAAQPRYIIENLKKTDQCDGSTLGGPREESSMELKLCHRLYISARGVGGTAAAVTLSQSAYNQPK